MRPVGSRTAALRREAGGGRGVGGMTYTLERFQNVFCDNCRKVQPMIFDVLEADEKNTQAASQVRTRRSGSQVPPWMAGREGRCTPCKPRRGAASSAPDLGRR